MQRTALCARKIVAFLNAGISPTVIPIYRCAAADAQPVGPQSIILLPDCQQTWFKFYALTATHQHVCAEPVLR
jgi:hypothetical protein